MAKLGTKSHPLHRKASIHKHIRRSRRFWRWYFRLNRLCVELGIDMRYYREV